MIRIKFLPALVAIILLAAILPGIAAAQDQDSPKKNVYIWNDGTEHEYPQILEGRGEYEIVLIHGLGANKEIWDSITPFLMGTFKVWAFELSGHGTTQPTMDPTIESEAERLTEFLKAEGIAYPILVGHGMGGMIALQYSIDHPADVFRLIMIDSGPRQLASKEQKESVGKALLEDYDRFVASRYLSMSLAPDVTDRILEMALRTDSASFTSLLMSSFDYDVTGDLGRLSVPLLVIGSEMMFPTPESSKPLLASIGYQYVRSLNFKRIARSGHYVMIEQPILCSSVLLAFGVSAERTFEVR